MPAVSRGVLQTPGGDVTLEEPPSMAHPYGVFSFSDICTVLAAIALLVILRFAARRLCSWRGSKNDRRPEDSLDRKSAYSNTRHHLDNPQPLHHYFLQGHGWMMDEKSRGVSSRLGENLTPGMKGSHHVSFVDRDGRETGPDTDRDWSGSSSTDGVPFGSGKLSDLTAPRFIMSRPPPPPPLTPPELSTAVFTFEDRRRSHTGAIPELDTSFFHQPNPDYMSSTTTSMSQNQAASQSPSTPRRRSYTKTLPIDVPVPSSPSSLLQGGELVFSPSSYPPTSPLLPGPPPNTDGMALDGDIPQEIEVQGEIISVLDDAGAGWTRHTRVYGGGVCLACAASGGDGHGGFYGDKVRPEEKR